MMAALLGVTGCGAGASKHPEPLGDEPAAASEPRGSLKAKVDLRPSHDCEEAFALKVYKHRAVQRLDWDEQLGRCRNRSLEVHYLKNKLSAQGLADWLRRHAARLSVEGQGAKQ